MESLRSIKDIRMRNNDLWMKVLEIALKSAPEETKEILRMIKNNDEAVSHFLGELIDEDSKSGDRAGSPAVYNL